MYKHPHIPISDPIATKTPPRQAPEALDNQAQHKRKEPMKALLFTDVNQPISYQDQPAPQPTADQLIVNLKAAALNHRDVWITKGLYPHRTPNTILGSDGVGEVNGRTVIINPNIGWGNNPHFPDPNYLILGMPGPGTFAQQVAVTPDRLVDKPAHLTDEQAAALPLAGLTAYRALITRAQAKAGDRVLISGIGGGVALFAFQFALALGCEVHVTSSSIEKIDRALNMGGAGGANYTHDNWAKPFYKETGGFDVIIDSAGGDGFSDLVKLARPGGRIALYGGTRGNWQNISPQLIFFRQISILGSTMGTDQEFHDMVQFVNQHQIVPVIDTIIALSQGAQAFDRMAKGHQFGKIVLQTNR